METEGQQGRIYTDNPDLLALLRENTLEKAQRESFFKSSGKEPPSAEPTMNRRHHDESALHKIYVDSPIPLGDEDNYKFVSTEVDELIESQDYEQGSGDDTPVGQGGQRREPTPDRYEDRNAQQASVTPHYVMRPRSDSLRGTPTIKNQTPGRQPFTRHTPQKTKEPTHEPRFISPIRSPLSHHAREEEEEIQALLQEEEYQAQLRHKIWEQSRHAEEIQIPRLPLEELDEEEKPKRRPLSLQDSLEDEYIVGDSLEQRQAQSLLHQARTHNNKQLDHQQQQQQLQQQLIQQQQQLLQQQQQFLEQQQAQMAQNYNQGYLVQDSLDYPLSNYEYPQQNGDQFAQQQGYYINDDSNVQIHQTNSYPNGQTFDPGSYDNNQAYIQSNTTPYYIDQQPQQVPESAEYVNTELQNTPSKPRQDFIELNKQNPTGGSKRRTYGKIFATKKEVKENLPPKFVPPTRNNTKTKVTPPRQNTGQSGVSDITVASKPSENVAHLWAQKARKLEEKKMSKVTGIPPGRGKALRKYGSESGVDTLRDSAVSTRSSPAKAHHVTPLDRVPVPQRSMAEPISSRLMPGEESPGQPIRHTIVTEDGQHLSVDINLKVSPGRGQTGQGHPVSGQGHHIPQGVVFQQIPPTNQRPVPSSWQQNPAVFRPHMSQNVHQREVPVHQEYGMVQNPQGYDEYHSPRLLGLPPGVTSPHPSLPETPSSSHYRVLPPIGSADTDQGRPTQVTKFGHSPPSDRGGSYMEAYQQQKTKKPHYKKYTLDDYRKLNKEIRLGGLGPELDNETVREKKEKRQRQLEYAKALRTPVGSTGSAPGRPPRPTQRPPSTEDEDTYNRRRVALEYAKSVPKPKARTASKDRGQNMAPNHTSHMANTEPEIEVFDIQKLQERHQRERQQVAMMRQNIENYSQA